MTQLTKDDVLHVAKLSKLNLTDEEISKFTPQLAKVVEFISQLSEVNTKDVEPVSQTTGLTNVQRPDSINPQQSLNVTQVVGGSEKIHNDYFVVDALLAERTDK